MPRTTDMIGEALPLRRHGQHYCGVINGFGVLLEERTFYSLVIGLGVNQGNHRVDQDLIRRSLSKPRKEYRIASIDLKKSDCGAYSLAIGFRFLTGMQGMMRAFLNTELPRLSGLGFKGIGLCPICGTPIVEEDISYELDENRAMTVMHIECADQLSMEKQDAAARAEQDMMTQPDGSWPRGLMGAAICGALGCVIWSFATALGFQWGPLLGPLAMIGVLAGYVIFRGKLSGLAFWCTIVPMCALMLTVGGLAVEVILAQEEQLAGGLVSFLAERTQNLQFWKQLLIETGFGSVFLIIGIFFIRSYPVAGHHEKKSIR